MSQTKTFSLDEVEFIKDAWKNGIKDQEIAHMVADKFGFHRTARSISSMRQKRGFIVDSIARPIYEIETHRKQDDKFRGAMLTAIENGSETMPQVPKASAKPRYIRVFNPVSFVPSQSMLADLAGE